MKKFLVTALSALILIQSLSALNWGGLLTNTSKVSTSEFKSFDFKQSNSLSLWASSSINKNLRFSTEGLFKYDLDVIGEEKNFTGIIDLTLLKLSGNWNVNNLSLALNAGRFAYSDLFSVVFAQTSDGLNFSLQNRSIKVGAYAGYTGLLNSLNVSMLDFIPEEPSKIYSLCPGYVPLILDFSLLNLSGNTLSLQAEYFIATAEYIHNKFYAEFAANGMLGTMASYALSAVVGSENFSEYMLFGSGNVSLFLGQSLIANIGAEYASGNNGALVPFRTVSSRTAYNGKMFSETSGLILPQASVLFVLNNMVLTLGEKVVLGIPENELSLNGFDTTLSFVCNVLSDLQVGCSVIGYADINNAANSNYSFALNVSLAF